MVAKSCVGRSGGVALFWRCDLDVRLRSFSKYHIDAEVKEHDGFVWRMTGIYGEPDMERRDITWKLLRILKNPSDLPWICLGDFNEILFSHEKEGGCREHRRLWRVLENVWSTLRFGFYWGPIYLAK